ncbi:MAG TPA: alkyl sulfatase dimerization domain-containing protein, partial [Gemmataceae bacterium]|nr:alkyl sulfatase dimerization domain-containing protein [Gemmataceae bacterium]
FARALLETAGGADTVLKRADQALAASQPQLALELASVVLRAEPSRREAHTTSAKALQGLAEASSNTIERNLYRAAAWAHRRSAER